jgi:mono/diheme cytochrome c family protein
MVGANAVLLSAMLLAGDRAPAKNDRSKELFQQICTACHTLARVKSQEFSKEEWAGRIKGMISEGAAVSDEEFSMIVDYLAKNFGTKE